MPRSLPSYTITFRVGESFNSMETQEIRPINSSKPQIALKTPGNHHKIPFNLPNKIVQLLLTIAS